MRILFASPPDYFEFTTERIIEELRKSFRHSFVPKFDKVINDSSINYTLYSNSFNDIESEEASIISSIKTLNWKYHRELYECENLSFQVEVKAVKDKYTFHKFLSNKQWRKFIDEMKSPVFLHNVTDLHPEYLYWVQKKKLVEKKRFLSKYRKFTETAVNKE